MKSGVLNPSIKDSTVSTGLRGENSADPSSVLSNQASPRGKSQRNKKLTKRFRILTGCAVVQIIIGFTLFLIITTVIQSQIKKRIDSQVLLTEDNEKMWAHYPGDTGTILTRNYTFFHITNQEQFILKGDKPKFKEIQGFKIQQLQDFSNIKYSADKNFVNFTDWLHFGIFNDSDTKDIDTFVQTVNVPYLGYWWTLKNSRNAVIFLEAFSMLFTNIQNSIIDTVISQGVKSQYLSNQTTTYNSLLRPAGIDQNRGNYIWNDVAFGLNNDVSYWIAAANSSFSGNNTGFSPLALNLKDYFNLSIEELDYIINQFNGYAQSIQGLIIENHYCQNVTEKNKTCDGHELAIWQLADSYVTNHTPPVGDTQPTDSICQKNSTCAGHFPQISAYYHNEYNKTYPQDYNKSTTFSIDMVRKWVDYNPSKNQREYNKAPSVLLHIGNLDSLFNNGFIHDQKVGKNHTQQTQQINNIKNQFQIKDLNQTRVFWAWVKYLLANFTKQQTITNQKLGISNTFTSAMITSFNYLVNNLQYKLISYKLVQYLQSIKLTNCVDFFINNLDKIDQQRFNKVCKKYKNSTISTQFQIDIINTCKNKYQQSWKNFSQLGLKSLQLTLLCDINNKDKFGSVLHNIRIQISKNYTCNQTSSPYCSDYQLALKQWANSTVTNSGKMWQKTSTTFAYFDLQAAPFQYSHFWQKLNQTNYTKITMEQAYRQFNFDNIFSAPMNIKRQNNKTNATNKIFLNYTKYVAIFVGLKGMNNNRTAREHILGYQHQFLSQRKNKYPPFGGDPSIQSFVAFNDQNITQEQAVLTVQWYTGNDNIANVGQYHKINNFTYMVTNYTKFNGNQTSWSLQSPWAEKDYFYGTNGKKFKPHQYDHRNISIYVPNLQRYGTSVNNASQTYERYGYFGQLSKLPRYMYLNKYDNKQNAKYYQQFEGLFNETSIYGIPFFMSKHYLLNSSQNWTNLVEFYNEKDQIIHAIDDHWQDSFVISQPNTGLSFQSALHLQANFYFQRDQLFGAYNTCLLPVFSVFRSGNLTQQTANKLLGPLFTALTVKKVLFIVGIVLAALGNLILIYAIYRLCKLKKEKQNLGTILGSDASIDKQSVLVDNSVIDQKRKHKDGDESLNKQLLNKEVQIEDDK